MKRPVRDVLHKALEVPRAGRAELARGLIASLERTDEGPDESAWRDDSAWREELAKRIREVREGKAKLMSSREVHAALARDRRSRRSKRSR
jgi:hypothetical protein